MVACAIKKPQVTHDFPEAMSPAVRAGYLVQWEKGKVLYDINCAKCHNTKVGRKMIVPDFLPEQLNGYLLRITNPKHEAEITDTKVTTEELGLIMNFLTYKKKNKG